MAESKNKLKGEKNKTSLIITLLVIFLIFWGLMLYGSYAYLVYVRTNNIENPGMNEVIKALETWFTPASFSLPLTGEVIKDVFVMQVKELWWVYLSIFFIVFISV